MICLAFPGITLARIAEAFGTKDWGGITTGPDTRLIKNYPVVTLNVAAVIITGVL